MTQLINKEEQVQFKQQLKQFCQQLLEQRVAATRVLIEAAQQSANSEEKSSAGDKYETSRAMSHLEKDMHTRQLSEHLKELAQIYDINTLQIYSTPTTGAVVQCRDLLLFLGAGLGKQSVNGQTICMLSPKAPLAKALQSKQPGDTLNFNHMSTIIEAIY